MTKTFITILAAIAVFASCQEWDPVFTGNYPMPDPKPEVDMDDQVNCTIKELKALYDGKPVDIYDSLVIKGQVISTDQSGNLYRSLYIQDSTGAIELKIARSSLYNDYKQGQWLYVRCEDLTVGAYGGMIQLGYKDESGEYETGYIGGQYLIDSHVFAGKHDEPREPEVITASDLGSTPADCQYLGHYVKFESIPYSQKVNLIIKDVTNTSLNMTDSQSKLGITTFAMTKEGFKGYMTQSTGEAKPQSAFGGNVTKDTWQSYWDNAQAYYVTHYFKCGTKDIQVRTSGYCKFADVQLDSLVITAQNKVNLSGILTRYNSYYQLSLLSVDGMETIPN